ncbi:uncharacterized protein K452DRAFT_291710 [Aplosporella prunicola CBS 121167]|uniref:Proteasome assembly chaperone 3 n=1 Tax=Aplosporella prunicola CBS 121167 TaxID=1176127 RepID=A0A6A6B262_9PEZI|nr:uncharacterized protein K452DRAFT_291710 [Aplosporella prunicola CBS 121167]KAF2137314.1 hypothetical protein K452DRAFT_291710 [Aplosporella prunicola CBS 121167]
MADFPITPEAFPAKTRTAAGEVGGVRTEVMVVSFAEKVMVTVSQGGRLGHWVHVPLMTPSGDPTLQPPQAFYDDEDPSAHDLDLLPMPHLTATTILGGTVPERDTVAQLVATQIASALATKNPGEERLLVVGLGLEGKELGREAFMDLVELVTTSL